MAGRLRRIQRERLADRLRDRIYPKPSGTSQKKNYEEEFLELLKRHGVNYDPVHMLG